MVHGVAREVRLGVRGRAEVDPPLVLDLREQQVRLLGDDEVRGCHLVVGEAELAAEAEAPAVDGAVFLEDHRVLLASLQLDHLETEALLLSLYDIQRTFIDNLWAGISAQFLTKIYFLPSDIARISIR